MPRAGSTRWLLWCGVVGPVLFVAAFVIEGADRVGYDPARVFVSQLSLGDQGWLQIANFALSGTLIVLFSIGLRAVVAGPGARWGLIMIGIVGLGMIIAGLFVTDPALGYPPGTPTGLTPQPSWHGGVHLVGALFVFAGLPIASFIFSRRFRSSGDRVWARYSMASGVAMLGFFVAANIGANGGGGLDGVAGWLQRAAIVIGLTWIVLLAIRYARRPVRMPDSPSTPVQVGRRGSIDLGSSR